ncbi:MAG: hypothetical protein ACI9XU_000862 [Arenicella sp.]|jgi:hypothetical protein
MTTKHSDLIAIANADLAKKLDDRHAAEESPAAKSKARAEDGQESPSMDGHTKTVATFRQEIWRSIFILNLIRGCLAIIFVGVGLAAVINPDWDLAQRLTNNKLFLIGASLVLLSAVVFAYTSKYKKNFDFDLLVGAQFTLDMLLAALLTYSAGGIESNVALLYLVVAATGSVVLPRKHALGLASGGIILMFVEHFYNIWGGDTIIRPYYVLLVRYSLLMLAASLLISYLAERIKAAEFKGFVPGNQTIEDYLIAEETKALKSALEQTQGNKTEAAKLLGMTFRSFRYKLTKYEID